MDPHMMRIFANIALSFVSAVYTCYKSVLKGYASSGHMTFI